MEIGKLIDVFKFMKKYDYLTCKEKIVNENIK
jgi:hypothetical protein